MKNLFYLLVVMLASQSNLHLAQENSSVKITPVTMSRVIETRMIETTLVRGEIESPNTPRTAAKVAAEVSAVYVDESIRVSKGQLLAELDDEAFKIAEELAAAEIQRLQAIKDNQQREVRRNKELFAKRLISQSVLDNVLTAMKQVNAELAGARARLKETRYQLSHTKIISPVNGIIQQRLVSIGDYVNVGKPMFYIVATEKLRARIYLPDSLSAVVHADMQVELQKDHQTVTGKIINTRPMLETGNRALQALVDFENKYHWKPGASISAKIILKEVPLAIAVPAQALVQRPAGTVLYKINGNTVIEKIVTTGIKQGPLVEITAGINLRDSVVVDGAAWLSDGAVIDIQKSNH